MNLCYRIVLQFCLISTIFIFVASKSNSQTIILEEVPPVRGVAHATDGTFRTPITILAEPLSINQDLTNLMDNSFSTFYQPMQEFRFPLIGTDLLLDFEFPPIPDDAIIERITIAAGTHPTDTDRPFGRGYTLAAYNRNDLDGYLLTDIGPNIFGALLVSPLTPPLSFPPLQFVQIPLGEILEVNLAPEELTLDNVRNLSVTVTGINDDRTIFDRVSVVYATIVYSLPLPDPVTLDVRIAGEGSCTVTSVPAAIDCPGDCSETFDPPGVTVDLTAEPDPVSVFLGWSGDCSGQDFETSITVDVDSVCIATCELSEFVLNPVFPALDDNINFISAENAFPNENVGFIWGFRTGSLNIGGNICNGTEIGIKNPKLLAIERANEFGIATHIFFIPFFNDLEFLVQLQALDVATCRTSNIIPQIIRKDESG